MQGFGGFKTAEWEQNQTCFVFGGPKPESLSTEECHP